MFLPVPNLRFFVVKGGSTCENKTDSDEKRIFHYKLSRKLSDAHRNISILKIPLYALAVELELNVSVCVQLQIFAHKTASHGLILQKLCIFGPITCHRLTLKGKFLHHRKKLKEELKIQWS